ncbi:MAG: dipeptide epimerase [Verrucomicrobia bacterium]|nr:dipeptide epimerase [Cytophagales bacterium]
MLWTIEELHLPLRFSWKIARGSTDFKTNFYVKVQENEQTGIGEVAPNIRYGESVELIYSQFSKLIFPEKIPNLATFNEWIESQQICNALRFGLESAFIHLLCGWQQMSIPELLQIPEPKPIATAFSLPIMAIEEMEQFYSHFDLQRFSLLKIKIAQENALESIRYVAKLSENKPLMVDANEAWTDVESLLLLLENLKKYNILFIEQPMPASHTQAYEHLKKHSPFEIMADESVTQTADFEQIAKQFHGVNMKLMKAGGYQNGLKILNETRKHGLKTMLGCMVETSLGIGSAINLSADVNYIDLDSFLYLKTDPINWVEERKGMLSLV